MINKTRILELQESYGDDPFPDDTIFTFQKQFREGSISFTYVAYKAHGKFYLTGQETKYKWFELLDFMETDNFLDDFNLVVYEPTE